MNILRTLLSIGSMRTKSLRNLIGTAGLGTMLFSFLFKKGADRKAAMKGFAKQSVGLLAIRGIAQLRDYFTTDTQKSPAQQIVKETTLYNKVKKYFGFSSSKK